MKRALTKKTRALFLPHTLGNVLPIKAIREIIKDKNIILIEDACDALGGKFEGKKVGSFGLVSTFSFYPAHHITMGEGGAVATDDLALAKIIKSIRDWGRDCYCEGNVGENGKCSNRFNYKINNNIEYDHRYVYSTIGYNLKVSEFQAALGVSQLKKADVFSNKRVENFDYLYSLLENVNMENYIRFHDNDDVIGADNSYFCFPISVSKGAPFKRKDMLEYLESQGIETRLIFSGNITRQPAFKNITCKIPYPLKNSNYIMKNSFFIGIYPKIKKKELRYIAKTMDTFLKKYVRKFKIISNEAFDLWEY